MLIINKTKPFYIDKKNKTLRMGNFKETGKEIEYENDCFIKIFEYAKKPIKKEELINLIMKEAEINKEEAVDVINYLIDENFLINFDKYKKIKDDRYFSRQNLYFSMIDDSYIEKNSLFEDKTVMILGLGGIGSNVALMLSRAGFKNFIIVDCDKVEKSNLIRQLPYSEKDIDTLKTDAVCKLIKKDNCKITKLNQIIKTEEDIISYIKESDLVLCTLDKPSRVIRRVINKACVKCKKPVLFSGFAEHMAMVGPFIIPNKTACLICIEKELNEDPMDNVEIVPSYGPLCSIISSIAANEIINYFTKYNKNNLIGKTLMFNMLNYKTKIIKWKKNNECEVCK